MGVNVATFAGFVTSGILGALVATTSVILPSYILVIIISKFLLFLILLPLLMDIPKPMGHLSIQKGGAVTIGFI